MKGLLLWGAGGHGKVVLDVARAMGGFDAIAFIDDAAGLSEFRECPVLGASGELARAAGQGFTHVVVCIGPNEVRGRCYRKALVQGLRGATLIHPAAAVSPSARIGPGTVVMPRVVINADAVIGADCIVNTGAVIEHDCVIGNHAHLSPAVALGGGVTVGEYAHLGIGAIALPGAQIGEHAVVGAGAVVLNSVRPGVTVAGVPARILARTGNAGLHRGAASPGRT